MLFQRQLLKEKLLINKWHNSEIMIIFSGSVKLFYLVTRIMFDAVEQNDIAQSRYS